MSSVLIFSAHLGKLWHFLSRNTAFFWAYWKSIKSIHRYPRILNFYSSEQLLVHGGIVKLIWQTKHTAFVHIDGLGFFSRNSSVAFPVLFEKQAFTITAYSFLKKRRRTIELKALEAPCTFDGNLINLTPEIKKLQVSAIQVRRGGYVLQLPNLELNSPKLNIIIPKPLQ